jgi:hypothetical protein
MLDSDSQLCMEAVAARWNGLGLDFNLLLNTPFAALQV